MLTLYIIVADLLSLYSVLILANVVVSWLYAFNIINTNNALVRAIVIFLYKVTEPSLRFVRQFMPNLGSLDISPAIVLVIIWLIQELLQKFFLPIIVPYA